MNRITINACSKLVLGMLLNLLAGSGFAAEKQCSAHFIQLFATSVPAKANTMKITLDNAGFDTKITDFKHDGKALYRVRTGPYSSKAAAEKTQRKMKAAFKSNASAQNSIIVNGTAACAEVFATKTQPQQIKAAAPQEKTSQETTQCYYVKGMQSYEGSQSTYVSAIQLTELAGKVSGYYFYRPENRDGVYGAITGTRVNNQISGQRSYFVEGYNGTDNISYQLGKDTLTDVPERYSKVSCDSVKSLIDVAKGAAK